MKTARPRVRGGDFRPLCRGHGGRIPGVSEVQDLIIRAVSSGGKKCFLVGDVKQSIYRFRCRPDDLPRQIPDL
jgi:hypothetical protein